MSHCNETFIPYLLPCKPCGVCELCKAGRSSILGVCAQSTRSCQCWGLLSARGRPGKTLLAGLEITVCFCSSATSAMATQSPAAWPSAWWCIEPLIWRLVPAGSSSRTKAKPRPEMQISHIPFEAGFITARSVLQPQEGGKSAFPARQDCCVW